MGKTQEMFEFLQALKLEQIKRSSVYKRNAEKIRRYPQAVADMIMEAEDEHLAKEISIDYETVMGPLYLYKDVDDFTTEELEEHIKTGIFPLTLNNLGEAINHITNRHSTNVYEAACSKSPTPDHALFLINLDAPTHIVLAKFTELLISLDKRKKRPRYDLADMKESFQAYDLKQQGLSNPEIAETIFPLHWTDEGAREGLLKKVKRGIPQSGAMVGGTLLMVL